MKKKTYLSIGYIFLILIVNGFFSLGLWALIAKAHLILSSFFVGLLNLYLFVVLLIRMCLGKIIIEKDQITIYKTGFYPLSKKIKKVRKKLCFQFKDVKVISESVDNFLFIQIHHLTITLSTNAHYSFLLIGFPQKRLYNTLIKYFDAYKSSKN